MAWMETTLPLSLYNCHMVAAYLATTGTDTWLVDIMSRYFSVYKISNSWKILRAVLLKPSITVSLRNGGLS